MHVSACWPPGSSLPAFLQGHLAATPTSHHPDPHPALGLQGSVLGSGAAGAVCALLALLTGNVDLWRVRCSGGAWAQGLQALPGCACRTAAACKGVLPAWCVCATTPNCT